MRRRTATNASKSTRGLTKIKIKKIKKKVFDGTADSINFPHGTANPRTNPIPMHHQGGPNQNVLADISTQSWWRRHIRTPQQIRSAYELKLQKIQASRFKRQSIFTSNCWRRKFIWSLSMLDPLILSGKTRSDGLFKEKVEEYFHFGIKRMRDWLQYKWSGHSDTAPTTNSPTTPSAHQVWTHKWSSLSHNHQCFRSRSCCISVLQQATSTITALIHRWLLRTRQHKRQIKTALASIRNWSTGKLFLDAFVFQPSFDHFSIDTQLPDPFWLPNAIESDSLCYEVSSAVPFELTEFDNSVGTSVTTQSCFNVNAGEMSTMQSTPPIRQSTVSIGPSTAPAKLSTVALPLVIYGPEEEIIEAYPAGVTDTSNSRQFRVSVGFIDSEYIMIGWDTCSMVDLLDPDMVPTNAVWISNTKTAVRGLGGSISYTDGTVRLSNLSLAVGGVCREHPIKVLKPPRGVGILFGIPTILQMKAVMALHRGRIFLEDLIQGVGPRWSPPENCSAPIN